jgi:hypothetical protein
MLHQASGDDPEFGWASFDPQAPSSARLRSCWSCAAAASCTRRRSSATRHPGDARPRRTSCRCRSIAPDDPPTATPPHHRPHRPQAARTAPRARHSRPAPHLAGGPSPVCCTEDAGVGVGEAVSNVCTGTSTGTDAQADAQNTTSTPHRTRRQRTRSATSAHIPLGGLLRPPAPRPRPTPTPCRCHRYGRRHPRPRGAGRWTSRPAASPGQPSTHRPTAAPLQTRGCPTPRPASRTGGEATRKVSDPRIRSHRCPGPARTPHSICGAAVPAAATAAAHAATGRDADPSSPTPLPGTPCAGPARPGRRPRKPARRRRDRVARRAATERAPMIRTDSDRSR